MSLDAMKQALDALEECTAYTSSESWSPSMTRECEAAITALRAAIEQAHGDWDEVEALRESLREHMAEIHRLRQWQGLTDEDVDEVERWIGFKEDGSGRIPTQKLVRYIEAKLKAKNS